MKPTGFLETNTYIKIPNSSFFSNDKVIDLCDKYILLLKSSAFKHLPTSRTGRAQCHARIEFQIERVATLYVEIKYNKYK